MSGDSLTINTVRVSPPYVLATCTAWHPFFIKTMTIDWIPANLAYIRAVPSVL